MNSHSLTIAAAALLASPAFAQGGDDCGSPTAINALGNYAFDTSAATTSGFDGGAACAGGASTINQDLFWVFTAPTSGGYQFDLDGSAFDTKLSVHTGGDCSATCAGYNDDFFGTRSRVVLQGINAGDVLLIQVGGYNTNAGTGTLNIGPDACTVAVDDALEDNDTCATAAAITPGNYPGLLTSTTDSDFYRITLQPGEILDVTTANATPGGVDVRLFDASCNVLVDAGANNAMYTTVGAAAAADYVIEVAVDANASDLCSNYDLDIQVSVDPCSATLPDSYEDNDDCASAITLGDGTYSGLSAFASDNDFFAIGLDPGATLTADIFFVDSVADMDLYLWDPAVACDTNVTGTGAAAGFLERGYSTSDDEQVIYTNTSGVAQNLILEIDVYTANGCNSYDLQLSGTNGMGGGSFGTNYCSANVNSTGVTSSMSGAGSRVAADNDLTLTASDLPTTSFGFFITSQTQGFVANPGGSSGNLCLSGSVGRYVGPGQIQNSGATGTISLTVDVTNTPQPNGGVAIAAGETWNFQLWHRDSAPGGSPTSNFTDGLSIDFQ